MLGVRRLAGWEGDVAALLAPVLLTGGRSLLLSLYQASVKLKWFRRPDQDSGKVRVLWINEVVMFFVDRDAGHFQCQRVRARDPLIADGLERCWRRKRTPVTW